ncbi:helix-turn-helix domain-containing protein [Streptomyces lavendofoliae]|uniref:Uncharacterized protein n=1 Tax=Streptomyces lavendofoliae TaxID=67314 RepID=A0A918I346_9ACTN|nr:helix-turn-helix domain-containing protein [Streptomyces lavendofoliae]GGU61935.1 hypothetical protein GCM10010274_58380 [Streptomyces lavendofoliae]
MNGASERDHGYARYKLDGCRCYRCGFAVSQYNAARERAIAYGTWAPYVDAETVRQHLRNLQACGAGLRSVAAASGVDRKRLQAILTGRPERRTGPQERVRPALATAVLAVEPTLEVLGAATVINAVGTHRRLQALVYAGWPQHHLAAALGWTDVNFSALLRRQQVTVRTARAVRDLYDQRWKSDPREHGVDAQAYSRARNHARRLNWQPVGAWDDDTIDEAGAEPYTGSETPVWLAAVEDALELEADGFTRQQAADRLGIQRSTLDTWMSRYRNRPAQAATEQEATA